MFDLLLPVRNPAVGYGASAVTRIPDRGHVAEVKKPMSPGWRGLNPGFQRNLSVRGLGCSKFASRRQKFFFCFVSLSIFQAQTLWSWLAACCEARGDDVCAKLANARGRESVGVCARARPRYLSSSPPHAPPCVWPPQPCDVWGRVGRPARA